MFDGEWDEQYKNNAQLSIWPWSELISLYMSHVRRNIPEKPRVLELGVGAGANIPFFQFLDVDYHAIEGSPHIVKQLQQKFSQYSDTIVAADFTNDIPFDTTFDVIIDRSSLTHNSTNAIKRCLSILKQKLNPGGFYIGVDWFSLQHSGMQYATRVVDEHTRSHFNGGNFVDVGEVHFSDDKHIKSLFEDFEMVLLEHNIHQQFIPDEKAFFATWNFVARNALSNNS